MSRSGSILSRGEAASWARGVEPIGARSAHGGNLPKVSRGEAASWARGVEPIGARSAHGGNLPKEKQ